MGLDKRSWRWLSAWIGGGRDCLGHAPRLIHQRPGARGLGERPDGHQPRAGDHGLRTVMKRLGIGALLLATVLVQVTWAPRIAMAGAFPNLALVAVIAITWTAGVRFGMAWACVAGLRLDLTADVPLGPHALALLACAYLTGICSRNLDRANALRPVDAAGASTALYYAVLV